MAQVSLVSAFRDAAGYIPRYFAQAHALDRALAAQGDDLHLALVWGDSTDTTADDLSDGIDAHGFTLRASLMAHHHGVRPLGSIVSPLRFRCLAGLANVMLSLVDDSTDVLLYIESDLMWDAPTILALMADLSEPDVAVAFPMVMCKHTQRFYDIWAYRINERPFTANWPYHAALTQGQRLVELSGAGSCAVMNRTAWRAARAVGFQAWDLWPGVVRDLRGQGIKSYLDTQLVVRHP